MQDIYTILSEELRNGSSPQGLLDALKAINSRRYEEVCRQGYIILNDHKFEIEDGEIQY